MLGAPGPSLIGTLIARPGFLSPILLIPVLLAGFALIVVYLYIPSPVRPVPDFLVVVFTSGALVATAEPLRPLLMPLGLARPLAAPVPVYIVLFVA